MTSQVHQVSHGPYLFFPICQNPVFSPYISTGCIFSFFEIVMIKDEMLGELAWSKSMAAVEEHLHQCGASGYDAWAKAATGAKCAPPKAEVAKQAASAPAASVKMDPPLSTPAKAPSAPATAPAAKAPAAKAPAAKAPAAPAKAPA